MNEVPTGISLATSKEQMNSFENEQIIKARENNSIIMMVDIMDILNTDILLSQRLPQVKGDEEYNGE